MEYMDREFASSIIKVAIERNKDTLRDKINSEITQKVMQLTEEPTEKNPIKLELCNLPVKSKARFKTIQKELEKGGWNVKIETRKSMGIDCLLSLW
jgi:hypothetical protein